MATDPLYRNWEQKNLTFSLTYAFSENYVLPLSHDEVVHGKKSLLNKMPGDYWQKFANLRLLYAYMIGHPGKKLLFMGGEFGQFIEWQDAYSLDWHLLDEEMHRALQTFVREINQYYQQQPALWEQDDSWAGFSWIDCENGRQSIISFMRHSTDSQKPVLVVCNFTPLTHERFRIGVPQMGFYREILSSDGLRYGGSGQGNRDRLTAQPIAWHNQPYSLEITVPPLAAVYLERE
jgi:1,4-alpha-glucan branching enzyme